MSVVIVIPARFASTRYPGKPLVELRGADGRPRSLIRRSWDAARQAGGVDRVVVATDDDRIRDHAEGFGAEVVMTSPDCRNGTERCAEAVANMGIRPEIVVNLQGDAPLTPAWFVEDLVAGLRAAPGAEVATPVLRCTGRMRADLIADRHAGRVGGTTAVFGHDGHALYFSKEVIPFAAGEFADDAPSPVFHHVGVYAYRPEALDAYAGWGEGILERLEGLEQLRFLERGRSLFCVEVEARGRQFWELNNPEDVSRLERMMREMDIA
ncbi:manno-octulosonate cytidylyltransferase [Paracoccus sp. 1_MG-2023]|uniref:3-deoxy-manno-octulosonate cytidylyltransferase n=1 Tax=unclassified Paracoccus (in: a-proteobacteria) TaxID=2688777 RepID=UPI001C084CE2|nr:MULTISPECIES: manno-octulosonate cytidylyltransferase [unclassified Paracoccus (in: a-proteobacteria)]MBU2957305.1 3-deoxy-manno-octulosonate cytidylyltransferase [Paracoccus sp. C2R09]MDO6669927.1 manno-octulosonate cytidylyltransferase [Paracoccus sp. 1_MG-2023]